ncbi:hypothetical protein [Pseudomonas sp. 5P_3.1_Bac2]|uniref:hypothetical protein n=1 Tax=Pseudomonas sp. 5P_3.1_Bac2 TaxID=2971617 RepID=UPI0021C58ADC|nr:hypothetical protein [Pseudomonas sp. 5P_3.1_Bac2]MCU1716234.1 hypothetical protein [Pseudomonas sp. 5P_3.1_Bac2]
MTNFAFIASLATASTYYTNSHYNYAPSSSSKAAQTPTLQVQNASLKNPEPSSK